MLSKEEIEKAKRYFEDEIHYEKTTYNCVNHYRQTIIDNHIILYKYIEQLESDKQKLIEKLEEEIKEEREIMKPLEHKSMAFHYANGRETLAQDILKILKGEKE